MRARIMKKFTGLFSFVLIASILLPGLLSVSVQAAPQEPKLTIHKFEQEPGTEVGNPGTGEAGQEAKGEPVEGVTFTIRQTHKFDLTTDIWSEVSDGKIIEGTTNASGEVVFTKEDGLQLGRYEVQETDGPSHVILNKTIFTVDIPMTNKEGTDLNYDVHIYPKNEIVRGDVELIKKDEEGNTLSNVEFILFKEDDSRATDSEGKEFPVFTTNGEGKIGVTGLSAGRYYFKETQTIKGLALNTSRIFFEVKKDKSGSLSEVTWTPIDNYLSLAGEMINYSQPKIEKDVEEVTHYAVNRDKVYTYNLIINTPRDIENYSLLAVTDTLDDRLEYAGTWVVEGASKENIGFTQKNQMLEWQVKDLSLLTPGEPIKISFQAKIKPDAELEPEETGIPNTATLDFDNSKGHYTKPADPTNPPVTPPVEPPVTPPVTVEPTEGGVKVIKVDKSDNGIKLKGAEFKLTTDKAGEHVVDATGKVIDVNEKDFSGKLENLITDEKGQILITGLTPGVYYLHETKAPTYTVDGEVKSYHLLTRPIEVLIEDEIDDKEVLVENAKSGWNLPTTGGLGTLLFTLSGTAFVAVGIFLFLRRDKKVA